jgi:hypothetical protein
MKIFYHFPAERTCSTMTKAHGIFTVAIGIVAGILMAGCTQPSSPAAPMTESRNSNGCPDKQGGSAQPSVTSPSTNSAAKGELITQRAPSK